MIWEENLMLKLLKLLNFFQHFFLAKNYLIQSKSMKIPEGNYSGFFYKAV